MMSSSFKSVSREHREFVKRNITDQPPTGRYYPKYDSVDKHVRIFKFDQILQRKDIYNIIDNLDMQNLDIEKPWFKSDIVNLMNKPRIDVNEQKKLFKENSEGMTNLINLEHKYKSIDEVNKIKNKKEFIVNKNKNSKVVKIKTLNVSSQGFHYWNPDKAPKSNEIFWPPLPKKTENEQKTNIDFNKQTNRIQIENMTTDANESRFEMLDKDPNLLSQQQSPIKFSLKSVTKRECDIQSKKSKDQQLTDKIQKTENNFVPNKLRKGQVDFRKNNLSKFSDQKVDLNIKTDFSRSQEEDNKLSIRNKTKNQVNMSKTPKRDIKMYKNSQWQESCKDEIINHNRLQEWQRDFDKRKKRVQNKNDEDEQLFEQQIRSIRKKE